MRYFLSLFALLLLQATTSLVADGSATAAEAPARWSEERAQKWSQETPWLVGANFAPAYAINQLEMWQAETFDLEAIDRELQWAQDLGFNSMRVFLHHLLWEQDSQGFLKRMEQFLSVAEKHKIGVMFVLFDSVWDPHPTLGTQRAPQLGLHNSGWVQSPGAKDLMDASRHELLREYVVGVVSHFKNDKRIQVWDLWNEPDNTNDNSYGRGKLNVEPEGKREMVLLLLEKSFTWAREAGATQPLTSGLWLAAHKADPAKLLPIEKVQIAQSDVISFHSYGNLQEMKAWVESLRTLRRPLLCTEYMARPAGSAFDPILGYLEEQKIAAYNWGFVAGKSNTIYPWDSWQKPYATEPPVWFHDIFRTDGTPYRQQEVEYIRSITKRAAAKR